MGLINLLIIEDEVKVAAALGVAFADHEIAVTLAHDGNLGLELALRERFDLVVLDLGLPGRSGTDVLSAIRQRDPRQPVLILTARDGVGDRIAGLEGGADDYLAKPFSFNELLARIRAILRRGKAAETVLRVADLTVDLVRRSVVRGGKPITLTPTEFSLLSLLMTNPGEPVTRKEMAEKIWDIHFDSETNVIDVCIRRVRMKVDDSREIKLIHTIRGIGYSCCVLPQSESK